MLMARDEAELAAHHFDVAFRSARSLPVRLTMPRLLAFRSLDSSVPQELEVAATAKELAAAQQVVAVMLQLPISQVSERLIATQSEIMMMQTQGVGGY